MQLDIKGEIDKVAGVSIGIELAKREADAEPVHTIPPIALIKNITFLPY